MKKKWFQFTLLLLAFITAVSGTAFAADKPASAEVVLVMQSTRRKTVKYMYKDLNKGLKKLNTSAKIEVIAYKNADKKLFQTSDVVIVVSEGQKNSLDPAIVPFVQKNAKNRKLITVSFLPGRRNVLPKTPGGVDVLSSASAESPAQRFVINELAAEVVKRLEK